MSRYRLMLLASGAFVAVATAIAATATLMSVQVRKAEVRDAPSFLGNVVSTLNYADKVAAEEQSGSWWRVVPQNGQPGGWLHTSALSTKTLVLKEGAGAETGASSGEMALAGKGFNSDVEAQFKADHRDIDFSGVDKMEKIKIAPSKLQAFAKDGGLLHGQGGVR